jgi:hypothetical protein
VKSGYLQAHQFYAKALSVLVLRVLQLRLLRLLFVPHQPPHLLLIEMH